MVDEDRLTYTGISSQKGGKRIQMAPPYVSLSSLTVIRWQRSMSLSQATCLIAAVGIEGSLITRLNTYYATTLYRLVQ